MTYENAVQSLCNHGNLPLQAGTRLRDQDSFLQHLATIGASQAPSRIPELERDVLVCLASINDFLRHREPLSPDARTVIDRQLANAMTYLLHKGWETHRRWIEGADADAAVVSQLRDALWRIGCAWVAVLDGDIEDLLQHLELESPW